MSPPTRRQVLASAGIAGASLAGCVSPGTPSGDLGRVDGAWPMDGNDPGHARRVAHGPSDPSTVWERNLDGVRAAGTPSVAGGRVYVPTDAVSDTTRHHYGVSALSAATGDERWRVPLRSEPNGPPAIGSGRVVASARRSLERGRVVAFRDRIGDAERYGEEGWLYDVDARVTAPPTIDGITVYVPDWGGRVHALSISDGSVRWSRRIETDGGSPTFAGPVAVADDAIYAGSQSGTTGVFALETDTGEVRWRRSTAAVGAGPIVAGDRVVVRAGSPVVAFDPDGTRRWSFNVPADDWRPLAADDRNVYVAARDSLYAIDRDGAKAWTYESDADRIGPPTVVGDDVFVRAGDRLVALSSSDGTERWSIERDGDERPVVVPEAVFLAGDGDRVVALGDD